MVLSADKERLKALLKETITLLCRNGLAFKSKFSIEALIGVTLDEDDIFLISINELVQTELNNTLVESEICDDEVSDGGSVSDGSSAVMKHHRARKRRHPKHASIKMEPLISDIADQSQNDYNEQADAGDGDADAAGGDSTSEEQHSTAKKAHTDNDVEDGHEDNGGNNEEDSKDIVFIKQEIDTWSNNTSGVMQSNSSFQGTSSSQSNMNFSLSDMNLVPISSRDEGNMMWQSNTQQPPSFLHQSSTTTTSSIQQPSDMQMSGQQTQQVLPYRCRVCNQCFLTKTDLDVHMNTHRIGARYRYYCVYCNKRFNSTGNLQGHLAVHTGKKEYTCSLCKKDFAYKNNLKTHLRHTHNVIG